MFDDKVRPIMPTSPTVERLRFLSIICESLGFKLYLNTMV